MICLADGDPAEALSLLHDVRDGTAPVIAYATVVGAHLLAGIAHRELGDQSAANQAAERALALAEADRLVLPFAMTGSAELLEALPRHKTAHGALLAGILDVLHGSSPAAKEQSSLPPAEELSPASSPISFPGVGVPFAVCLPARADHEIRRQLARSSTRLPDDTDGHAGGMG